MQFVHVRGFEERTNVRGEQYSQGSLWPSYIRKPFDRIGNKMITQWSLERFEATVGLLLLKN